MWVTNACGAPAPGCGSSPSHTVSKNASTATDRMLWVCMTPLGMPVVPEVNIISHTSFGPGLHRSTAARS